MSTPQPPLFLAARVIDAQKVSPLLTLLKVEAAPDVRTGYRIPGQYVQIKEGAHKPGFFALANKPGGAHFELLIKSGSPLGDALSAKKVGDALEITAPAGKGYPLAEARGNPLYLVGVGSGLGPLRAVLQYALEKRGEFGALHFYYGARHPDDFPFMAEQAEWARAGVELVRCCSKPEAVWHEATGHVQDVLKRRKPALNMQTCFFACGMKEMVAGLKAVVPELGAAPERVFQNF